MSKSDENFLTLAEAIQKFSADETLLCLADAGDIIEDANFVATTAHLSNYCYAPERRIHSMINLKTKETAEYYEKILFKYGLRTCFFELQTGHDKYRELCGAPGMHVDLIFVLLSPICPYVAEHIWTLLNNKGSILDAKWLTVGEINELDIERVTKSPPVKNRCPKKPRFTEFELLTANCIYLKGLLKLRFLEICDNEKGSPYTEFFNEVEIKEEP